MKPNDNVGVTFVNTVLGRGHLNGIVNLQLGVFNFSETKEGEIELDPTIACRLRMDYSCASALRDALDWCINKIEGRIEKRNAKANNFPPEEITVNR